MTVYFVGAGPGDPDLLTQRAARVLARTEFCIYAGSLVSPEVVAQCPPGAVLHDSARLTLEQIIDLMQEAHARGKDVTRLHTGDPSLYGAIGEQMRALDRVGIAYEIIPGVSAFQAAAAALRCELTAPKISQTVVLTRAPGRTPVPDTQTIERVATLRATLCLFLSVGRIAEVARQLVTDLVGGHVLEQLVHLSWVHGLSIRRSESIWSQWLADQKPRQR